MDLVIGIILSFTAAVAWGSSMIFFKVGMKTTDPLTATYVKGLIGIPILVLLGGLLYSFESLHRLFYKENLLWLFLAVITIALGDFFSLFSLKKINVSISQPITACYPMITTLILLVANIEEITIFIWIGTALIITGVGIISFYSSRKKNQEAMRKTKNIQEEETEEQKQKDYKEMVYGIVLAVFAAIFWGATIAFTRILLEDSQIEIVSMMGIRNGLMVVGAFILVVIRTLFNKERFKKSFFPPRKEAIYLMIGGAISWCIGGVSFFTSVNRIGAAISTPLSSISPLIVSILGFIFLKEKLRIQQLVGVVIIIGGSILLSITF